MFSNIGKICYKCVLTKVRIIELISYAKSKSSSKISVSSLSSLKILSAISKILLTKTYISSVLSKGWPNAIRISLIPFNYPEIANISVSLLRTV